MLLCLNICFCSIFKVFVYTRRYKIVRRDVVQRVKHFYFDPTVRTDLVQNAFAMCQTGNTKD
jgi:hypothetical protein